MNTHPALSPDNVAVITGAADGIGLAAAKKFSSLGMRVCLADIDAKKLQSVAGGDFYILCPDNDVDRDTDNKRMAWTTGDLIENRPPLSRWHPDYNDKFTDFMENDKQ